MIRHIVAWKFKEYAGGASAMENAMELKKQLEALRRGNLPGLVSMNVQLNCQRDEMEEATEPIIYDVVMTACFPMGKRWKHTRIILRIKKWQSFVNRCGYPAQPLI